jgi:deoxyribonuclease V
VFGCVDVSYRDDGTVAGCLLFKDWTDSRAVRTVTVWTPTASAYVAGEFYLREMPAILSVLSTLEEPLNLIVVDGYVWLGDERPGLGARLHATLDGKIPVVGVAKTPWRSHAVEHDAPAYRAIEVKRGRSEKPLYVTSVGIDVVQAAQLVAQMSGPHRIPTLLKAVDTLVRSAKTPQLGQPDLPEDENR